MIFKMEKLTLVKIGGNVIDDNLALKNFLVDFSKIQGPKILVHGGGKLASKLATQLGIKQELVEGRRITNAETLDITLMTYAGLINKKIVALLQQEQCNALGLSGVDGGIIQSSKRKPTNIDYGYVGDVEKINTERIHQFLTMGLTLVICPLTYSTTHGLLNTNADAIASEMASALSVCYELDLIYCFEKAGVLLHAEQADSVIPVLNEQTYQELKLQGIVKEGMIPKLDNIFKALHHGVKNIKLCLASELLNTEYHTGTSFIC